MHILLPSLAQPGQKTPPSRDDKVMIFGDGNTKGINHYLFCIRIKALTRITILIITLYAILFVSLFSCVREGK